MHLREEASDALDDYSRVARKLKQRSAFRELLQEVRDVSEVITPYYPAYPWSAIAGVADDGNLCRGRRVEYPYPPAHFLPKPAQQAMSGALG